MRRSFYVFIITLFCIQSSWALESVSADHLTLDQALRLAYEHNPRMVQAREDVNASRGARMTEARWQDPQLEIEPDRISVKQPFDPLGVRYLKGKIARHDVLLKEQLLRQVWGDVYLDVRKAYTDVLLLQRRHQLMSRNLKAIRVFFSHVQMRHRSGALAKNQMQRANIELLSAQSAVVGVGGELAIAKARLNLLLGRSRAEDVIINDVLDEIVSLPTLDSLIGRALEDNPFLRTEQLRFESAAYTLRKEQLSRLPSFAVGFTQENQKDDDDMDHNTGVTLELTVPLWTLFNQGAIDQAKSEKARAASRLEDALRTVDFEVFRLYQEAKAASEQARILGRSRQEAQEMFALASVRYQEGDMSFNEYLEQLKASIQAQSAYLDAFDSVDRIISELEKTMYGSLRKEEFFK